MKKLLFLLVLFSVFFISWCDIPVTMVTEYLWSWICVWQWNFWEIKWYANCKTSDWWTYNWDVWWHAFHWKWKLTTSGWQIQDWYFNNWDFVAWKVTFENGNSGKWLWSENWYVELWKFFYKNNWNIEFWEYDSNWNISYWMRQATISELGEVLNVWNFKNNNLYNWYINVSKWCFRVINWNLTEITRTVTNTVYRDMWVSWLSRLTQLWSIFNPYNVNVTIK